MSRQFWGASMLMNMANVKITDQYIFSFGLNQTSIAQYELLSSGVARTYQFPGAGFETITGEWLISGSAGDYQARATLSSGSTPNGGSGLGTWLTLSTTRSWSNTVDPQNSITSVLLIEIRDTATSTVRTSATITIEAIAEF
jgi:hypothetical protein